jgi:hypothetical protein
MHHVLDQNGRRLFPPGLKLISHWGLRDELKAQYAVSDGLARQEMIQGIMEKIITQEIPALVINNPAVDWNLATNQITPSPEQDAHAEGKSASIKNDPEPDTRYARILEGFKAEKRADPYYPTMPSLMDRRFQKDRQIPEARTEELLRTVLGSPLVARTGKFIAERLGRGLRPFDIWYDGFKSRTAYPEAELDKAVSKKYPDLKTFQDGLPGLLKKLGFSKETSDFLASKIVVDAARGIGHALGAERRPDCAHLRTRVPAGGMNYKGYNIAVHELGHNCEQVLSLNRIDHTLLSGVPNAAFTEAFAFMFQNRDLELLGMSSRDTGSDSLGASGALWATYEISGVSLVDMQMWRWLYSHPKATPAELKDAVIAISKAIWNAYYAPVFGVRDVILLGIYSHMIDEKLYLPDYPLGHIIAFQIEEYVKGKNLGAEMERMCRLGSITPDEWMKAAVGSPVSVEPILAAARQALDR